VALELAVSLASLFSGHGGPDHLDEALEYLAHAERVLPAGHLDLSSVYASTAAALLHRYAACGRREDLDAAVTAARQSVPAGAAGHRPSGHVNLAGILRELYNATGDIAHLDESISQGRIGLAGLQPDSPDGSMAFATLAASLMARFARLEHEADLAEAIKIARLSVSCAPCGNVHRFTALGMLAAALRLDFELMGRDACLTEAIDLQRESVGMVPDGHPESATYLVNLAMALLLRFDRLGVVPDIDAAAGVLEKALALNNPLMQALCFGLYADCMRHRSKLLGAAGNQDGAVLVAAKSVDAATNAVAAAAGRNARAVSLIRLANSWAAMWELTSQEPDRARAAEAYGHAAALFDDADPNAVVCVAGLAVLELRACLKTAALPELVKSAELLRAALPRTLPGGTLWALVAASLLAALAKRHELEPGFDTGEALDLHRRLSSSTSAPPRLRIMSGMIVGSVLMSDQSALPAAMTFEEAMALLPVAVWHGIDRASQEAHLADITGLASSAAASQISVNATGRAVELLEQGRGIMWARLLELRQEHEALGRQHPELATRLRDIAAALNAS
jgi:tetratricopeptide (TPR) repeat protein